MRLNSAISARLCAPRHANCAGSADEKKGEGTGGERERERGLRRRKMEMRFAIGPCNFSNLNLILDATRYIVEARQASRIGLARPDRKFVTVCGEENALNFYKAPFCCSRTGAFAITLHVLFT